MALCETPPPSSRLNLPPEMIRPSVNPLALVRSPTTSLSEKADGSPRSHEESKELSLDVGEYTDGLLEERRTSSR